MEIIKHRVNTIRELQPLDVRFGTECDIRSRDRRLILHHEPHQAGDSLENYLSVFSKKKHLGPLILNAKEDGLEEECLNLLAKYSIRNFFFLDLPIPAVIKLAVRKGIRNIAVRVSEYESKESALAFKGLADWIWLDCFRGAPLDPELSKELKKSFKICLVSPELEGYPPENIAGFRPLVPFSDAVCTKHEELWETL